MIEAAGIPVIEGDMDVLAGHARSLVEVGAAFVDTGARVHATWQGLGAVYRAPETEQLLAATLPARHVTAAVGEDVSTVGRALGTYAEEVRAIQIRLDALRAQAGALDPAVEDAAERSNEQLGAVNVAMADFDDAQRRCANAINALFGAPGYRVADDNGQADPGEFGATAAQLDAAAAAGGVPWGAPEQAEEDDGSWWSDLGHGALDVIGLVPVFGEVADGINAVWYTAEGDYLNAGLSAAAMIPLVGWAATGSKLGIKGYKAVHSVDGAKAWLKDRPSMVPRDATELPWSSDTKFPIGQNYRWIDPGTNKRVDYHAHGRDPDRLPTENAGQGPVYRVKVGNHWLDGQGNLHTRNSVNPKSPAFSPRAANDTHIPFPKDQPAPDRLYDRIIAPNPLAVGDPHADAERTEQRPDAGE